jgi:DNA anti-recombination protein RmuC
MLARSSTDRDIRGVMATMIAELYDALIRAGADEASARGAAVAVADYDRRLADVGQSLQRLETRLETGFAEVDTRFAEARSESDARFNQVHLRLAELRAELDTRFAELRAEMDTRFAQVDTRFAQVDMRFAELRAEMDTRFAQVDARFAELRAEMAGVETRITRWFIGVLLAQFASVLAILIRLGSS